MVSTSSTNGSETPFEYAPAPESRSVVDIRSSYGLFIDGTFVDTEGGRSFKTINPATEEVLAEVAEATADDVDRAVRAARRAYTRVWSRMPGRERAKYLFRIARIMQERSRELAVLESIDNGKPIRATSTCRWRQHTSSTTRGGRTSWSTPATGSTHSRWESPAR
jgi:aldehyde dehydrogenase (NAD+)